MPRRPVPTGHKEKPKPESRNPTPSPPPASGGESDGIIGLLLRGEWRVAEIRLRERLAAEETHKQHRHRVQIERVEQYFRTVNGQPPWPVDCQPGNVTYWRGKLGGILAALPLATLLADVKAHPGKQSLIYFLSTDRGQRASRWEMLLVTHREAAWAAEKARERMDAARFFEQSALPCGTTAGNNRGMDFDALREQYRQLHARLKTDHLPVAMRAEYAARVARIELVFARFGVAT